MITIGITGGIGSGKSTVSKLLAEKFNIPVIDADEISRRVSTSEAVLQKITEAFGKAYINSDGSLNRSKMAATVFSDEAEKKKLTDIIHPLVREEFARRKAEYELAEEPLIVYDCPLLIEEGLIVDVDEIVVVYVGLSEQVRRIVARSGITENEALARIRAQMPLEEKLDYADYIIYNDSGLGELAEAVEILYDEIMKDKDEE